MRQVRDAVLCALADADVAVLPVGGCMLLETAYPTPTERHCHGVELVVGEDDLTRAARILQGLDIAPSRRGALASRGLFRHRNGLELVLDTRWTPDPGVRDTAGEVWSRSRPVVLPRLTARGLSPADELLRVLARAALGPGRSNLRWALDAVWIIRKETALDWEALAAMAAAPVTALYVSPMLRYLADDLDTEVPEAPRAALARVARNADLRQRETAFLRSAFGLGSTIRALWREPDRSLRFEGVRFVALPSRSWLRRRYPGVPGWAHPGLYLFRPLRYLAATARMRVSRTSRTG